SGTIDEGSSPEGEVAASGKPPVSGGSWSYTPPHLGDGTYTAQATQSDGAGNSAASAPVTFSVDTTAPAVTLNALGSPTKDPTPTLTGSATEEGEAGPVSVTSCEGSTPGGEVAASGKPPVSGGSWSSTPPHLGDGTYTARA